MIKTFFYRCIWHAQIVIVRFEQVLLHKQVALVGLCVYCFAFLGKFNPMLDGWQKLHAVKFFLKFDIANKYLPSRLKSFYQEKKNLLGKVDRAKNLHSPLFLRISMSKPKGLLRNFWLSLKILFLSFWYEFSTLSLW